jgi:hypothetical protein
MGTAGTRVAAITYKSGKNAAQEALEKAREKYGNDIVSYLSRKGVKKDHTSNPVTNKPGGGFFKRDGSLTLRASKNLSIGGTKGTEALVQAAQARMGRMFDAERAFRLSTVLKRIEMGQLKPSAAIGMIAGITGLSAAFIANKLGVDPQERLGLPPGEQDFRTGFSMVERPPTRTTPRRRTVLNPDVFISETSPPQRTLSPQEQVGLPPGERTYRTSSMVERPPRRKDTPEDQRNFLERIFGDRVGLPPGQSREVSFKKNLQNLTFNPNSVVARGGRSFPPDIRTTPPSIEGPTPKEREQQATIASMLDMHRGKPSDTNRVDTSYMRNRYGDQPVDPIVIEGYGPDDYDDFSRRIPSKYTDFSDFDIPKTKEKRAITNSELAEYYYNIATITDPNNTTGIELRDPEDASKTKVYGGATGDSWQDYSKAWEKANKGRKKPEDPVKKFVKTVTKKKGGGRVSSRPKSYRTAKIMKQYAKGGSVRKPKKI